MNLVGERDPAVFVEPNSYFVSTRIKPCAPPARGHGPTAPAPQSAPLPLRRRQQFSLRICPAVIGSSCAPAAPLVVGVTIVAGSFSFLRRPSGN